MKNMWIKAFAESLKKLTTESNIENSAKWTKFMVKVMKNIGGETDCYVQAIDSLDPVNSGELLGIDVLFFRKSDWGFNEYDPPALPVVAVELENNHDVEKIIYCLWKLLCLRVTTRALICYQSNMDKLLLLRKSLEQSIIKHSLMDKGSLFVIIGNDKEDGLKWDDYYKVFEWKDNKLESIEIFE